jgi:tRNA G18 (ribose-2'-O)-methylase SpoU
MSEDIRKIEYKTLIYDPNKPRNVVDHLKWLGDEEITAYLDQRKNNFSILLVNIDYDNNAGNIIRSANAFGANEIILYGRRKFDRRASVGVEFYMQFRQVRFAEDIDQIFSEYDQVVALENGLEKTVPLQNFEWDKNKKTLICVGQEGNGIPKEILDKVDLCLEIPQLGSVRSLNVSAASAIVMYDYCIKTRTFEK